MSFNTKMFRMKYRETGASQVAQVVKNLPGNAGDARDGRFSLDQEDPLE